jgi:asparagine synthase (glutamine-hydrolysing)
MCGLAGLLNLDAAPASPAIVGRMGEAVRHRGPDGSGVFTDGSFGLAHRRLAIIDLSPAAHQPLATPDGRQVIAYNGEVYNFQELRLELEARGHAFRSRTDSEVVLHAVTEWGPAALERLNGMFAFAVWDRRDRTLLLARDRYGVKPLYYSQRGPTLLFGSEVKALLAHPAAEARLDREALVEYLTFQNLFTSRTLFEGVRLLPAGSWLRVREVDRALPEPTRYWDFRFAEPDRPLDEQAYVEELHRLFCQAVNRQLVSDVEVGAYLSGGMDSGSITAVAARRLPFMRTFTAGFDLTSASGIELGFDERQAAERMSYLFKTEHYEMVLKAGDMERVLPRLAWHLEEPRIGQSYPNYYVARLASRFCKVVLSGAGGDELFGGYPWRYYRAAAADHFEQYVDKYYAFWQRLVPNGWLPRVLAPVWADVKEVAPREIFRGVFLREPADLGRPEDYINHSLYFEARTFLHALLVVEDKLSMAHGLETRVPFLDNDLVDFAMRVPVRLKLGRLDEVARIDENEPGPKTARYFSKHRDGKLILRRAMARRLPAEITERYKQGFSAPDASWFKGESIDYVRRVVFDDRARIYDFLDPRAVRELVSGHLEGRENRRLLIWSLLSLERWCDAFLGKGRAE